MENDFSQRVYKCVQEIPIGFVSTYGRVATACGLPGAARAVGNALHKNPYPIIIPCHRVVNRDGKLAANFAFDGKEKQKGLLELDGVFVSDDFKVPLAKHLWDFND